MTFEPVDICFVIPAYNEEPCLQETIRSCREFVPGAKVLVIDNNSTDQTKSIAEKYADHVIHEERKGKATAVSFALKSVHANIVIMVDADNTYSLENIDEMISLVRNDGYDMVVGDRISDENDFGRPGHHLGNRLFSKLFNTLFGQTTRDPFSGLRVFSKRYLDSLGILTKGFELESELNIHAFEHNFRVKDVSIHYTTRKAGSHSKLNTIKDGLKILSYILSAFQRKRPMAFYSWLSLPFLAWGGFGFLSIYLEFLSSGKVLEMPSLVTYLFFLTLGAATLFFGVLNENINKHFQELKRRGK